MTRDTIDWFGLQNQSWPNNPPGSHLMRGIDHRLTEGRTPSEIGEEVVTQLRDLNSDQTVQIQYEFGLFRTVNPEGVREMLAEKSPVHRKNQYILYQEGVEPVREDLKSQYPEVHRELYRGLMAIFPAPRLAEEPFRFSSCERDIHHFREEQRKWLDGTIEQMMRKNLYDSDGLGNSQTVINRTRVDKQTIYDSKEPPVLKTWWTLKHYLTLHLGFFEQAITPAINMAQEFQQVAGSDFMERGYGPVLDELLTIRARAEEIYRQVSAGYDDIARRLLIPLELGIIS